MTMSRSGYARASGWVAVFILGLVGLVVPRLVQAGEGAQPPVILVVGDSLSAGYGVRVGSTWVALLQQRLTAQGYGYRVVNASVSGETTGGGRARLPRAVQLHRPAVVILELGANDGLRGLPLTQMRDNLDYMIQHAQGAGAKVVLLGMHMPPNYGRAYAEGFHSLYGQLARKYDTPLVEFFLDGVALDEHLMQADGIHPTASAQPRLLENVWPTLQKILKK
jgi:acyl-CoA thioesterase I